MKVINYLGFMEQIDLTCILGMRKCVMGHFMENETDYQNVKLFHDTIIL